MRAIRVHQFGGPEELKLEEIADPKPGPHDIVVRVRAAGVNPVDVYMASGTYGRKPALPYTPGSDGAGEVEAVGREVTEFKPGDRVFIAGHGGTISGAQTYAERCVCRASQLHPLAARATFAQGAALGVPYTTAHRALFGRAGARGGETVLVHGATGGVGIAAVQLAHASGMRVIGTGGTDEGLKLVRAQGADAGANHKSPNYLDEIKQAAGARGVDVVIEMLANVNLDKDLSLLAPRGRIVVVGSRGRVEIDPRQVMVRDAAIFGMTYFNIPEPEFVSIQAALVAGLANGTLAPVVGKEFPLADAAKAHEAVMGSAALGKVVLLP